jgi:pyruvate dehydrogenase E2 component (dihydrolipoamide acetyltransferase)
MPSLSPTMSKGNLSKWCKQVGDEVAPGDILAEVETDKATVDYEMQEDGWVAKLLVEEGAQDIDLGEIVAILVDNEEDIAAFIDYVPEGFAEAPTEAAKPVYEETIAAAPTPAASTPTPATPATAAPTQAATPLQTDSIDRLFASPFARKLAREKDIDLSKVQGTGPKGRIIAEDVENFKQTAAAPVQASIPAPAPAQSFTSTPPVSVNYEDKSLTQMRKIIAERLTFSKDTIPHYYVTIEVEVDKLNALRTKLNGYSTSKISLNDMVIKATALASTQVKSTNSSWQGDFIREYKNVDMSVAVSTPKGLITPIIKNANVKGLQAISIEMKDLASRARENKLKPEEFMGGTFSISNLGMFGVNHFSAIINPPQACILAIGGSHKRVLPNENSTNEEDKYRVANVMAVTLSSDHRVVDGAEAATWGQHFKKYIENPELMLL